MKIESVRDNHAVKINIEGSEIEAYIVVEQRKNIIDLFLVSEHRVGSTLQLPKMYLNSIDLNLLKYET